MGCFNDLPKDVVWLIFRDVIVYSMRHPERWEEPYAYINPFVNDGLSYLGHPCWVICNLASLSLRSLALVRSKCYRVKSGWFFKRGAINFR